MEGGESAVAGQNAEIKTVRDSKTKAQEHDAQFGGNNDDGDYCRICRGEGTDELPLFYPCKCSGSIRFVHQDCLMEWLAHSQKKYCELCKTTFRFTKLYDHNMPHTLPLSLFLRQLCLRGMQNTFRWMRYLLVGLVWLAWLPWSIRQVWRALFWLADGSWGIANDKTMEAQSTPLSATGIHPIAIFSRNATHGFLMAIPQTSGFLSSLADFLSVVPFKFFRLLYPNLANWLVGLMEARGPNGNSLLPVWDRQPSFLSEVRYLKHLTSHHNFNSWVMDVLEGQLICLLIVTGFILVFLIREWVINQQPAPDAAGPNGEEDARPVGPEDGVVRGPARRRRRRPAEEGREGREERIRRIAVPRPRRRPAVPDAEAPDANDAAPEAASSHPDPVRDAETPEATFSETQNDTRYDSLPRDNLGPPRESFTAVRPVLRAGTTLEDAASIRRTIEEDSHGVGPEWPGLEIFKDLWDRAAGDPSEVLRIIREEHCEDDLRWVVSKMEKLQRRETQAQSRETSEDSIINIHESGLHRRLSTGTAEEMVEPNPSAGTDSTKPFLHPKLETLESADLVLPTHQSSPDLPGSWTIVEPAEHGLFPGREASLSHSASVLASPHRSLREEAVDEDGPEVGPEQEAEGRPMGSGFSRTPEEVAATAMEEHNHVPSAAEAMVDWLWRTDRYVPPAEDQLDEDDGHVVEDVNDETAFVPLLQEGTAFDAEEDEEDEDDDEIEANLEVDDQLGELRREPEVMAAAMAAGVDFNAEAMEEAEDLDGLLELIGMQGPLTGMVQNVIFSEVLITLTLAASVWLPYIWGKIALLLLANPVGVFVRAPWHLLSRLADTSVDVSLFISCTCIYALGYGLETVTPAISAVIPGWSSWVDSKAIRKMSLGLASLSGARLEKEIYGTVRGLRPDLPIFSILSHQALRQFQRYLLKLLGWFGDFKLYLFCEVPSRFSGYVNRNSVFSQSRMLDAMHLTGSLYRRIENGSRLLYQDVLTLRPFRLGVGTPLDVKSLDYSLVRWNTQDRIIAIVFGYAFLTFLGYLYIQLSRLLLGLRKSEKLEGMVADSLSQAGGVMKVILIIGIEMIIFPLYCGLLLDIALMPLFEGVGLHSRLAFMTNAPMTALFVHWFVGTCYMFHFALFVSMCRRIMRKGVLYFIRDPDDPTFHPVRDVLERPITSQLRKIAFSGLVYGGLVVLCLGGIVLAVSKVHGIFPIHWTSNEPVLEFPIDLLFYNLLLPTVIRMVEPAKRLNAMYEWCFRTSARSLRLTHFLFNEERADEQGRQVRHTWLPAFRQFQDEVGKPVSGDAQRFLADDEQQAKTDFIRDGGFVLAPGSDSVRIQKGSRVFLTVDENNNRADGQKEEDEGSHGKRNKDFVKVYIPPMFRTRIAALVVQVWAFAAITGIIFTIVPLSLGRGFIYFITQSSQPPNDLYAFSIGLHLCGVAAYMILYYKICIYWTTVKAKEYLGGTELALPRLWHGTVYVCGLAYMASMFSLILPIVFSTLVELYFVIPLNTYLASAYAAHRPLDPSPVIPPTIHIIQTWTLGLVYLRAALRFATSYPHPQTRIATAISSILRDGIWRPDVKLATRAFVLPSLVFSAVMLMAPPCLGWVINAALGEAIGREKTYQYAYPGVLGVALVVYCAMLLKRQIGAWRSKIRDDVYLIGERLHNFGESRRRQKKGKQRTSARESTVPERLQIR